MAIKTDLIEGVRIAICNCRKEKSSCECDSELAAVKVIVLIREAIAREIEAGAVSDDSSEHYKLALPVLQKTFAAIARGE